MGLACNAGKAISGNTALSKTRDNGKIKLIIVAGDAAENTVKIYSKKAEKNSARFLICQDPDVCACVGHPERKVIAVLDDGFAQAILKEINTLNVGVTNNNE